MGIIRITHITVYTEDQSDALGWYTEKLGFKLCEDVSDLVPNFRWLTVSPSSDSSTQIILMPALNQLDLDRIGTNPMYVLGTDDCHADYEHLAARGVNFVDTPKVLPWGISAMFTDLYNNPYNLIQRKKYN